MTNQELANSRLADARHFLEHKESFRPMALKTERRRTRFSIKQKPQKRLNKADL
jgi:hypothetical protein